MTWKVKQDIIAIVFIMVLGSPLGWGQITFQRTFEGVSLPGGFLVSDVHPDTSGGYWVTGTARKQLPPFDKDFFLMRLDSLGFPLWANLYGYASIDDSLHFGLPTLTGHFWMAGKTPGPSGSDVLLLQVNANGAVLTSKTIDWGKLDLAFAGAIRPDGAFYLAGRVDSVGAGGTDAIVMGLDANANLLWSRILGGAGDDGALGACLHGNGIAITGYARYFNNPLDTTTDVLFATFDQSGLPQVVKAFGEPAKDETGHSVAKSVNGTFYMVGDHQSSLVSQRGWVARFSAAGTLLLYRGLGFGPGPHAFDPIGFRDIEIDPLERLRILGSKVNPLLQGSQVLVDLDSLLNPASGTARVIVPNILQDSLVGTALCETADGALIFSGAAADSFSHISVLTKSNSLGAIGCGTTVHGLVGFPIPYQDSSLTLSLPISSPVSIPASLPPPFPLLLWDATLCRSCATVAAFVGPPDTVCLGSTSLLTSTSQTANLITWQQNGATIGSGNTFSQTWSAGGPQTISLIAMTLDSVCRDTMSQSVFVLAPPIARFDTLKFDERVLHIDSSSHATSIVYHFSNSASTTDRNPLHWFQTLQIGNPHESIQIASNQCGQDTATKMIPMPCDVPRASFRADVCDLQVTFTDLTVSICSYTTHWDFGDGSTSIDPNPVHTYATDSLYWVQLTVFNGQDTSQYSLHVQTGGVYSDIDTWRVVPSPKVPYEWIDSLHNYPGDTNHNRIEDILESGTNAIDIMVALGKNDTNTIRYLKRNFTDTLQGRYLAFVALRDVPRDSIDSILSKSNVIMLFSDHEEQVLASETSTNMVGINELNSMSSLPTIASTDPAALGTGIIAGVFDSGITNHRFATLFGYKTNDSLCYDAISRQAINPSDSNGHGSRVAQLLGGGRNRQDFFPGAAPGVELADIRVANSMGAARPSDVIAAMEWAIQIGSINLFLMPIGFHNPTNGHDPLSEMVNIAVASKISVVVAAGNGPFIGAPGAARDAITVANVQNDSTPHPSSAWGVGLHKPDLAAPGTNVYLFDSLRPSLKRKPYSGTSYSAAVVAGAVAVLWGKFPHLTPLAIKDLLIMSCVPLGSGTWDSVVGNGMLNAKIAYDSLATVSKADVGFLHPIPGYQSDSPDLIFDTNSGITANVPDTIRVAIRNGGAPTGSARVRLWGAPYGTSVENWLFLDTLVEALSPGLDTISLIYKPRISLPNVCFRAQIDCPQDSLPQNNFARKNRSGNFPTQQDTTFFEFDVVSNSCACVEMKIPLPDLPDCWRIRLSDTVFNICPTDPPRRISGELWKDSLCCDTLRMGLGANGGQRTMGTGGCCLDSLDVSLNPTITSPDTFQCGCLPASNIEVTIVSYSKDTLWAKGHIYASLCDIKVEASFLCCDSTSLVFATNGQTTAGPGAYISGTHYLTIPSNPAGAYMVNVWTTNANNLLVPIKTDTVHIAAQPIAIAYSYDVDSIIFTTVPNNDSLCNYNWTSSTGTSGTSSTFKVQTPSFGSVHVNCIGTCDPCGTVTDSVTVNVSTAIFDASDLANADFAIFPNPFSSELILRCNLPLFERLDAKVTDLLGNPIKFLQLETDDFEDGETKIALRELASGMYMVMVIHQEKFWVFKIVKQ